METTFEQVLLTRRHLLSCARTFEARYSDERRENARLDVTGRFLTAALALEQVLRAHTRCALVNHCGSHGRSNLEELTARLCEALSAYAALVTECAHQRRECDAISSRTHAEHRFMEVV
jgi:hypothetical protein